MTDISAQHRPQTMMDPYIGPAEFCEYCDYTWPCDAELLRRERDEAKQDTFRMGQNWEDALAQRDAAEADAKALAKAAFRFADSFLPDADDPMRDDWNEVMDACAAHDARVSHNHGGSATDDEREARKHPPGAVAIVAHTPPFDSVRDEGRRP